MPKPVIEWAVSTTGRERSNSLGYASSNRAIAKALSQVAVLSDRSQVAVHYCYPKNDTIFRPRPGKVNVLFTMYENRILDEPLRRAFDQVDLILTPSQWCANNFRQYTDVPVDVVPLGVDAAAFPYRKRRLRPGERFRWLYLGAPNARKFTVLPELFSGLLGQMPEMCELYIKTQSSLVTSQDILRQAPPGAIQQDGEILRFANCTIDNRFVPRAELLDIYHSAHGFLFLHCGEGFGLTGLEAMATGLAPVIAYHSGVTEYATSKNCLPVGVAPRIIDTQHEDGVRREELPWPDVEGAAQAISVAMTDFRRMQKMGKRAAHDARKFSWDRTARGICSALGQRAIL